MKKIILWSISALISTGAYSQLPRPMASPQGKVEQRIGLTDVSISYYRPSKNDRVIFGDVVPFDELWRTGANENTMITSSDALIFGKDTLAAGTYAIFTKPSKDSWTVYFYTDHSNWGTPDEWDESKVAMTLSSKVMNLNDVVETFSISFDKTTTKSAALCLAWDKTAIEIPFEVPTAVKMDQNIKKLMNGPSANDYYASAEFYYKEKKDLNQALTWATKAVELRGEDAYWMLRLKALIEAELGNMKAAIETAKKSLAAAEKAENKAYVEMNKASIEEWSKKKK
jgi:tetratricopeptide (TPR) repeat protein